MSKQLWEDKYVFTSFDKQTLNGFVRYYKDKWGAVLYIKNILLSEEPQRMYENETEYLQSIHHLLASKSSIKRQLNKAIKWTSSRFNVLNKSEVIDEIIVMHPGEEKEFSCGTYSEKSYCGGYHYKVYKYLDKIIVANINTKNKTIINLSKEV